MASIVSLGGMIFGYDTGQISGFLEMEDFLQRFHDIGDSPVRGSPNYYAFTPARSGTIVGLLSIGTLVGALLSAPVADRFGRRACIVFWNIMFCVGVIIQIATENKWYQLAIGRLIAGFGVGGLSVLTPLYQSETAPRQVRGSMVSTYQLFITLGIFVAYCINYGTEATRSAFSWRLPMGIGFVWPVLMIIGICFLPESPRWDYRHNNIERARRTVARSYGVPINHWEVQREMREIKEKYDAEHIAGVQHKWYEVFTGPRMLYRILLGATLQMLQQLTGANYFFYYGTTIFNSVGLSNSYVTSMILGGINFGSTFLGLWVVEKAGRRNALIWGASWMFMCFLVFASVGSFALDNADPTRTPGAGTAMIVFACLFIVGYAMTWAPVVWCVVGEMFPTRYRTMSMGIATASNWVWNFLLSFFTPFITNDIGFRFGYVFAGAMFAAIPIVYFFLEEHQGRTLEEIDTMYITHVSPRKSSKWEPPAGEDLVTADSLYLDSGARNIRKQEAAGAESEQRVEKLPPNTETHGIHEVPHSDDQAVMASGAGVRKRSGAGADSAAAESSGVDTTQRSVSVATPGITDVSGPNITSSNNVASSNNATTSDGVFSSNNAATSNDTSTADNQSSSNKFSSSNNFSSTSNDDFVETLDGGDAERRFEDLLAKSGASHGGHNFTSTTTSNGGDTHETTYSYSSIVNDGANGGRT